MIIFVIQVKPYEKIELNRLVVVNESTMQLLTYLYMFFLQSFEQNRTVGSFFIAIFYISIIYNFFQMLKDSYG